MPEMLGPYELNTIVTDHVLDVLALIPDGVFHCCVTSPPYWGLRDYGLPPLVWGGDAECEHEWGAEVITDRRGLQTEPSGTLVGPQREDARKSVRGSFCLRCNAWCGSLGLEPTPELFVEHLVEVMREVLRVLRDDGTLWLNLGDSYQATKGYSGHGNPELQAERFEQGASINRPAAHTGGQKRIRPQDRPHPTLKPKDLVGIPWRVAFALQADGWWLRSDIIWHKPNCMPESVRDRPTKSHEYLFLLSKQKRYFYDADAVQEETTDPEYRERGKIRPTKDPMWADSGRGDNRGGLHNQPGGRTKRNRRTVWTIPTKPFPGAHFATFPPKLIEPCIKAGTSQKGCCPECGAGWVRIVEKTGHVNQREPAHVPNNTPSKTDSTGWAPTTVATDRWQPACDCDAGDPVPCTVLDPFIGAGTTALVAEQSGRDWLGIDLNPEYTAMATERIRIQRRRGRQLEMELT